MDEKKGFSLSLNIDSTVLQNLLDKIEKAVGWLFTRNTPRKQAIEYYIGEIEKSALFSPLEKAALISNAGSVIKAYCNQNNILLLASHNIEADAKPEEIEDEWIAAFFEKAKLISEENIQLIWAKILAEKCNDPGKIPKSVLYILEKMEKEEALSFVKLCSYAVVIDGGYYLLVDRPSSDRFKDYNISFDDWMQLEALGLIKTDFAYMSNGYSTSIKESHFVTYFDEKIELPSAMKDIGIGRVLFTKNGEALCEAIERKKSKYAWEKVLQPFLEDEVQKWKKHILEE